MYSVKKVFLEISQNSQENNSVRIFFLNKVAGLRPATLLKKDFGAAKFLITSFFYTTTLVAASA